MGKKYTIRHKTRRKLEGISNLCDVINQHLADIGSWYDKDHPEIVGWLLTVGTAVEELRKTILKIRDSI